MKKSLALLLVLLTSGAGGSRLHAVTPTSTITATNTPTPTFTPTVTVTTTEVPNRNGIPNWKADDRKGYQILANALYSWGTSYGDSAASGIPFRKHPASPGLEAGDCLALVAGTAGLVSRTSSIWDQGFVGVAAAGQGYNYARVFALNEGVFEVKVGPGLYDEGDILIPGIDGKLTGTAAVAAPEVFTSLSMTPKLRVLVEETVATDDTDIRIKVRLNPPQ